MHRRRLLILLSGVLVAAGPGLAQSIEDRVIEQLKRQGATRIQISRTLLGRTKIEARGPGYEREIIVNPRTGEILRDYWEVEEEGPRLIDPRSRSEGDSRDPDGPDDDGQAGGGRDDGGDDHDDDGDDDGGDDGGGDDDDDDGDDGDGDDDGDDDDDD